MHRSCHGLNHSDHRCRQTAPLPIGRSSLTTTKDSCRRYFFDQPAGTSPLVIEVVTLFDVRDQCRALRPPSQQFLCLLARRRVVGRHEGGEEAEVGARVRSLDADNRQLQLPADSLSDFPEWYTPLDQANTPAKLSQLLSERSSVSRGF